MISHDDIQLDLAGYATARLGEGARRRVEEHLHGCGECRQMVQSIRQLAGAMREGGDVLVEPHPPESALRRYARAGDTSGSEGIARHLAVCAPCSLEVGAWAAGADGLRTPQPSFFRPSPWV